MILLLAATVVLGPAGLRATAIAQNAPAQAAPDVDTAIRFGLDYLVDRQHPDGFFHDGPRVAMTGLAVMSFLAAGHTPGVGRYGSAVRSATDWMVSIAPDDGYFGRIDGSRMYGHGIATLALLEAYGVEPDPQRRDRMRALLRRAMKIILDAQDVQKDPQHAGGWRYEPQSGDSDLSLSGWNTLALRAAKNLGLDVPPSAVSRAVDYVLTCFKENEGGFAYQPGREATAGMTGVAVLNLYLLTGSDKPELQQGASFLREHPVDDHTRFPYYSTYYVTQAAYQAGGETWDLIWPTTQQRLLASQMPDGGWPQSHSGEEPGRTYATTMALLTLTVPYRLLPIYQR